MSKTGADAPNIDWGAFRSFWSAIVPLGGAALLAQVGAILSVLFRVSPPTPGARPDLAILYVSSLLPVPVVVACLLVGYVWARPALAFVLWVSAAVIVANVCLLYPSDKTSALVLTPFLLLALVGLRWVYGTKLKTALAALERNRRLRWGRGFGWMLIITVNSFLASASVSLLAFLQLKAAGGPDWTNLPGPLRLLPVALGGAFAFLALGRMTHSRASMTWLLSANLIFVASVMQRNSSEHEQAFALTALTFDAIALVALVQPSLGSFCARQRQKELTKSASSRERASGER